MHGRRKWGRGKNREHLEHAPSLERPPHYTCTTLCVGVTFRASRYSSGAASGPSHVECGLEALRERRRVWRAARYAARIAILKTTTGAVLRSARAAGWDVRVQAQPERSLYWDLQSALQEFERSAGADAA
ncbi:hypothetical protein PENSPDRAFT_663046 [Peniophora sp. CONT]|nr:hypothetical protein PENSPDRAFT_663046 [Peniophora sp. CONT]